MVRPRAARARPRRRPPRRRPRPAVRAAAAVAAVLAIAGAIVLLRGRPSPPPSGAAAAGIAHSRAAALVTQGRELESLPLFREACAAVRPGTMELHRDFSKALYAAGFDPGDALAPASRSSVERVGWMREAIEHMEIANRLGAPPADRAEALGSFGEMMLAWGFPWEAFLLFRKAEGADPRNARNGARAEAFMTLLEHPHRYRLESVPVRARGTGRP